MITINLLPEHKKNKIRNRERFLFVLKQELVLFSNFLLVLALLISLMFIQGIELGSIQTTNEFNEGRDSYAQVLSYEKKFKETNKLAALVDIINKGHLKWSVMLEKISALTPDDIYFSSIKTKDYEVTLAGTAKSRDTMLKLQSQMNDNECFEEVDIPLSDLVSKTDVDFQIKLIVNESCIKNNE